MRFESMYTVPVLNCSMRTLLLAWLIGVAASAQGADAGNALWVSPRDNVVIPQKGPRDLSWVLAGDTFDCLGPTEAGYSILYPTNNTRIVLTVPYRDEWGHIAADYSGYSVALPENTIRVKTAIQLKPGGVLLRKDHPYPAISLPDGSYRIEYQFHEYAKTVQVAAAKVQVMSVGKTLPGGLSGVRREVVVPKQEPAAVATEGVSNEPVQAAPASWTVPMVPPKEGAPRDEARTQPEADAAPRDSVETGAEASEPASVDAEPPVEKQPEPDVATATEAESKDVADARTSKAKPTLPHAGIGAKVVATSTKSIWPGEGPPGALVDGDPKTRWASAYEEPQTLVLTLDKPMSIEKLRLRWENAAARRYSISVSEDGQEWKPVHRVSMGADAKAEARVDEVEMSGVRAKAIRFDLLKRINPEWGFSLYEIEVISTP